MTAEGTLPSSRAALAKLPWRAMASTMTSRSGVMGWPGGGAARGRGMAASTHSN
ncbi:Uncharacterised protein [Bordetella pertussis]|nr:Uncharacterised protein [Bordetella pertussis]